MLVAEAEEMLDLFVGCGLDDGAGDEAIEAGVRGEGDALDRADEDALGVDELAEQMADARSESVHDLIFELGRNRGLGQCRHRLLHTSCRILAYIIQIRHWLSGCQPLVLRWQHRTLGESFIFACNEADGC